MITTPSRFCMTLSLLEGDDYQNFDIDVVVTATPTRATLHHPGDPMEFEVEEVRTEDPDTGVEVELSPREVAAFAERHDEAIYEALCGEAP